MAGHVSEKRSLGIYTDEQQTGGVCELDAASVNVGKHQLVFLNQL